MSSTESAQVSDFAPSNSAEQRDVPRSDIIDCIAINDIKGNMGAMTIRNIDDTLKARLRILAAQHGRSMEEEARDILRSALAVEPSQGVSIVHAIRRRVAHLGDIDLALPEREPIRTPHLGDA